MQPFIVLSIEPLQTGLLHPLLVHFPIGIVYFALLISLLPQNLRNSLQKATSLALLASSISAILAAITGYLLSRSGDYDVEVVSQHQWGGIITALFAVLAYFLKKIQRQLIWICALSLTITGHWGGELTHGTGYLNKIFSTENPESNNAEASVLMTDDTSKKVLSNNPKMLTYSPYQSTIVPILKSNCYSCHSALKKKGGLRLDNETWIHTGGKNGLILTKGDPEKSTLYTHLRLPLDDEKHMPPKGKKQLNPGAINTIFQWIKMGAPFGEIELKDNTASQKLPLPVFEEFKPAEEITQNPRADVPLLQAADTASIHALLKHEVIVTPYINRTNGLYVNLVNVKKISPEIIHHLKALQNQVIDLKYSNITTTEEELEFLQGFKNLTHLQLSGTNLSDNGLIHVKGLSELRKLNLYGTLVTDHALELIGSLKNIQTLNLWNTAMTESAIRKFIKNHPHIAVEFGQLRLNQNDTLQKQ